LLAKSTLYAINKRSAMNKKMNVKNNKTITTEH